MPPTPVIPHLPTTPMEEDGTPALDYSPQFEPLTTRLFNKASDLMLRATRKGFWPMADQGVVSLGNFATTALVARGLANRAQYGQFSMILEFMFFLVNLQSGLITFPLTVKGAVSDDATLRRLTSAAAVFTLILGVPTVIATMGVGVVTGNSALALSAVVALILWQMQEATRRGLWAHFRHKAAVLGDSVSYLGQAILIGALYLRGSVSLVGVFNIMTITSILGMGIQAWQIGLVRVRPSELLSMAREFWIAGRWVALTNLSGIFLPICGSWVLAKFHSVAMAGDLFAISNLLKLCNPVMSGVAGLITPAAARKLSTEGVRGAERISLKFAILGTAMLAPYLLFIALLPTFTMKLLYGANTPFVGFPGLVRMCVMGYWVIFASAVLTAFLNGVGKARYTFYGQIVSAVGQFAILMPANIVFGLQGYIWGGTANAIIQLLFLLILARRGIREVRAEAAEIAAGRRLCSKCGYDIRATPDRCPECGTVVSTADATISN